MHCAHARTHARTHARPTAGAVEASRDWGRGRRRAQVSFLACPSFSAVQQVMVRAKRRLGEILSAVEFLDRPSLDLVLRQLEARPL